jgi:predicted NUDIX family phosphoesterase/thymidylate kinase
LTNPTDDDNEARIARIEQHAQQVLGPFAARQTTSRMSRRPFFVEFAGTPKAGKTTALDMMDRILRRNRYRVRVVTERASTSPLRNKHDPLYNIWTAAATLTQIVESQDRDDHIVLIDRGIFDALCWMEWFRSNRSLSRQEYGTITDFLRLPRIRRLTDLVFVLTASPEAALNREVAGQLTSRHGGIMNHATLHELDDAIDVAVERHGGDFTHMQVDTTETDQIAALEQMAHLTLDALDRFRQSVLVLPKAKVRYLPSTGFVSNRSTIKRFLADIARRGDFMTRDDAEARPDCLQPIPIAYFLHQDRLFVFRRSEQEASHRLHGKYIVWAGGHVRRDDAGDDQVGDALLREIQEELYIPASLEPEVVGLVLDDSSPRSRLHVGVVHRIRVDEPTLAMAMDRRLFIELRGSSSMTSQLIGAGDVPAVWPEMEEWSRLIIREHLRWPPP